MNGKQQALIVASVAGLLAAASSVWAEQMTPAHKAEGTASCYGINKCKGAGECSGKGNSCAGTNGCKGQGFIELKKETCLKIQGGRLTADEVKS